MKTITLSDEAYYRIKMWKESPKDSFSKVIERLVPSRGSAKSVLNMLKKRRPLSVQQEKIWDQYEKELHDSSLDRDPWKL